MKLNTAAELIDDIRQGKMVVIMDDEERENEGDLVIAAECVRPEDVNFMAKNARGLICLTLTRERCEFLQLPLMVNDNRTRHKTSFTVSIEAASGVTTGISAADRARTIQVAVAGDSRPGRHYPARPHLSDHGPARWRAAAGRPHRSRLRPRPARGLCSIGGYRRNHERRRAAWPAARTSRNSPAPTGSGSAPSPI